MPKIVHFEGIPGSGKSTASQRFCELLLARGVDAYWSLEESENHPIMPKDRLRLSLQPTFPSVCLEAWRTFVRSNNRVAVLDGYALQNTVRFLYANLVPDVEIGSFFASWQEIAAGNSAIVFFTVSDPPAHYESVLRERGDDWAGKLFAYVEGTPIGKRHGLQGKEGFVEFWSRYQDLCDRLLQQTRIPLTTMEARSWSDQDLSRLAASNDFVQQA